MGANCRPEAHLRFSPMGSFQRGFLGYRRSEVDAAMAAWGEKVGELDRQLAYMSGLIVEREREIRDLQEELRLADERHDRSLGVDRVDLPAARGGPGTGARPGDPDPDEGAARGGRGEQEGPGPRRPDRWSRPRPEAGPRGSPRWRLPPTGTATLSGAEAHELFEGLVKVQIGPLGDFSQLVSFEDAAGQIDATSEISVERFSEGRATLSMRLDEPVELLRELEERSPLEFKVRQAPPPTASSSTSTTSRARSSARPEPVPAADLLG